MTENGNDQFESARRDDELMFAAAFRASPDAVNINRLVDGVFIDVNEGFAALMGWSREEVVGLSSLDLDIWVNPEDRASLVRQLLEHGEAQIEADFHDRVGNVHRAVMSAKVLVVDSTQCILSVTRDVTELRRIEAEKADYASRMQQLSAQLMEAETAARRGIAEELHDRVSQSLALAKMHLQIARSDVVNEDLDTALAMVDEALRETRAISSELAPPLLFDEGIVSAISHLADALEINHGLHVEFDMDLCEEISGPESRALLFRIVHELLMNVVKHAEAHSAKVSLVVREDICRVEVTDAGKGLDGQRLSDARKRGGFGLAGIMDRVSLMGGSVDVASPERAGTRVVVLLPFREGLKIPSTA